MPRPSPLEKGCAVPTPSAWWRKEARKWPGGMSGCTVDRTWKRQSSAASESVVSELVTKLRFCLPR